MVEPSPEFSTINVAYMKDNEYSIQVNRWLLKPIGAWPVSKNTPQMEKNFAIALKVTCYIFIIITIIPSMLFIFFEEVNILLKLKAIGPISHWIMGGLNYCIVSFKNNEMYRCIKHMEADWRMVKRTEDRQLMLKNAKVGRSMAYISAISMHFGVSAYCLLCVMIKVSVPIGNETILTRPLPCPVYTGFIDSRYSPMNEILVVIQCISSLIVNSITVGVCGMAAVFAMHACGQLGIVMSWLDGLVDEEEDNAAARKRLALIVQHHLRALSFISYIEETMHQICLVELLGCTFNLCMIGYYMLMEAVNEARHLIMYFIVFLSMAFNIFIFCYIGEILSQQCKEVGRKAYMTNWYRLPRKTALGIIMIIARSSATIKITAGKLVQLSIATFASVIKTAFAYLNMLRTIVT